MLARAMISIASFPPSRRDLKAGHTIRAMPKRTKSQHVVRVRRIKLGDKAPDNRKGQCGQGCATHSARLGGGTDRKNLGSVLRLCTDTDEKKKVNMCAIFVDTTPNHRVVS